MVQTILNQTISTETLVTRHLQKMGLTLQGITLTADSARVLKVLDRDAILSASHEALFSSRELLMIRQLCAFVTKNPTLAGSKKSDRADKAISTFLETERKQAIVEKRVVHYLHNRRLHRLGVVGQILLQMQYEIFRLLGPEPTIYDLMDTVEEARFGPGAVQGVPMDRVRRIKDVTPYGKLSPETVVTVTDGCLRTWGPALSGPFRRWIFSQRGKVVQTCKGVCVPKDALTDRFIAVEPYLNSFIQLGQMEVLFRYLRRWGVNLNDQTQNQRMAYDASKVAFPNGWATLDLKSASDSVNYELIRWLLPPKWFAYLDSTRSPFVSVAGKEYELKKFSSMGNAITFPLESLIFSALILSVRRYVGCSQAWTVFGDDIIVSQRCTPLLTECLRWMGFSVNNEKSFITGKFRESCGVDYLEGHSVRPTYLKGSLKDPRNIFSFHNRLQAVDPYLNTHITSLLRLGGGPVGPSPSPNGDCDTHFVAPLDVLQKHGLVWWNPHNQNWSCRYRHVVVKRYKIGRREKEIQANRSLMAWLASGMPSEPHVVRGPERLVSREKVSHSPYWLALYDPSWT